MIPETDSSRLSKGRLLLLLATFALLFGPFCNKAIHIDDIAFLELSQMIDWNPLVAFPKDYFYQGHVLHQLLPYEITHPLLIPYVLKILLAIFGGSEIAMHLAFLVFPAVTLASLSSLHRALYAAAPSQRTIFLLLFSSLPAFLVNAQNLMTDVPFLTFLLLAIAAYVFAVQKEVAWSFYLGGAWLTLAVFTAYQAMVFIPVIFAYAWGEKKISRHFLASLAIPALTLLAWLLCVYLRYDIFPILKSKSKVSIGSEIAMGLNIAAMRGKFTFFFGMIGASTLLALTLHHHARRTLPWMGTGILLLAVPGFSFFTATTEYSIPERTALALLSAAGILALSAALRHCLVSIKTAESKGRGALLLSWIVVVMIYNLLVLPFGSARYLLPILPPLMMILLDGVGWRTKGSRALIALVLLLSVAGGLAAATSDLKFADSYRTMAKEVESLRNAGNGTFDVWYIGEWGMRFYMDRAGARYLLAKSNAPKAGDLIVLPEVPRFWVPARILQARLLPHASREFRSDLPLRLFNRRSNAGFYCHFWGLLPYAFSSEPDEVFTILRVVQ